MLDLAIRGGTIIDGTGISGFIADIGMISDRTVWIGRAGKASHEIDATGLVVAPGFIDVHTHFDTQVFGD